MIVVILEGENGKECQMKGYEELVSQQQLVVAELTKLEGKGLLIQEQGVIW